MINFFKKLFGITVSQKDKNPLSIKKSVVSSSFLLEMEEQDPRIAFEIIERVIPEAEEDFTKDELDEMHGLTLDVEEDELEEIEVLRELPIRLDSNNKQRDRKIKFSDKVELGLDRQHHQENLGVEEVIPVAPVKPYNLYDPLLDLNNYKYPVLDLLETHSAEKIVLDPNELEANKNQIIATL